MTRLKLTPSTIGWMAAFCLAVGAGSALTLLRSNAYLDTDAAQYLSTATNLKSGDGSATDIIYYDEQYRFGEIPAPQTVFPPGLPIILASMLAGGVTPVWASFLAGLIGFCATGLLIFALLRRLRVAPQLALLASAIWLALGLGWANVLMGRAEVTYTLATVAGAMLLCVYDRPRPVVLIVAGALAAAGLLVRYQGLFFLLALAIWVALPLRQGTREGLRRAVVEAVYLLVVPAGVAAFLAFRNWNLIGAPGGGPVDTVRAGIEGLDLIRFKYWTLTELTGLSAGGLASGQIADWLVAGGAALLVAWLVMSGRTKADTDEPAQGSPTCDIRSAHCSLAVIYITVSILALVYLASSRAGAYLQGRFLVPLVPFALTLWAVLINRWFSVPMIRRRGLLISAMCVLHAGLLLAQAEVFRESLADMRADRRVAVIERAMNELHQGITLREYLLQTASRDEPIFAEPAQHLWISLGRPVLGATPAGFSNRVWNEDAVRVLSACYGARLVLFFPQLFLADAPHNANKTIFLELARGDVPAYLRPVHRSAVVELYAVDIATAGVSCPEPRRPS